MTTTALQPISLHKLARLFDDPTNGLVAHAGHIHEWQAFTAAARALRRGGGERIPLAGISRAAETAVLVAMELDPECPRAAYDVIDAASKVVAAYMRPSGIFRAPMATARWVEWAQDTLTD